MLKLFRRRALDKISSAPRVATTGSLDCFFSSFHSRLWLWINSQTTHRKVLLGFLLLLFFVAVIGLMFFFLCLELCSDAPLYETSFMSLWIRYFLEFCDCLRMLFTLASRLESLKMNSESEFFQALSPRRETHDLTKLPVLNEEELLKCLKERYTKSNIYVCYFLAIRLRGFVLFSHL